MKPEEKLKMNSASCKVKFLGWRNPPGNWGYWVKKLSSLHQSTWKDAGIYEAIMCSTYAVKRYDNLILELASRWRSQTNTFNFPFGEATLTLEDMLVLGGFSASGVSALSSLENDSKSRKIKDRLELERLEIQNSKSKSVPQGRWMEKFMGSGSELEHAAFLSLWLSRFVFVCSSVNRVINKDAIPIAARLSRGIKIALGPVVLAMLYRDLTALAKMKTGELKLFALFHLVQIWAWERFPMLKPVPNCMYSAENCPRLARWSTVKILNDKDLKSTIDSAGKAFLWCPYGPFVKREGSDQCMKTIELQGFDSSVERYQPRRVARQFGFDQDFPNDNIQVKAENDVDCCPPGFSRRIEVIDVVDSDDESDRVEKHRTFHLTSAQIKMEDHEGFVPPGLDEVGDSNNDIELVQLQHSVLEFVNGSVHEKLCPTSQTMKASSQVKAENARIEVINVADSDSDDDCTRKMTKLTKLHVPETRPRKIVSTYAMEEPKSVQIKREDDQDFVSQAKLRHPNSSLLQPRIQ